MTYHLSLTQGIGYTGLHGHRAYVARITGSSPEYGLAREFCEAASVERDHFGRSRYTRTYHYDLTPGLYEISEHGERCYRIVAVKRDSAGLGYWTVTQERLDAIVRLLMTGMDFETARRATRPEVTHD